MVSVQAALVLMTLSGAGQTVLLDFYSDSCGPCRAMTATVDAVIAKGYAVRRVNVEQDRALAAQFNITNIPCFVMLVDGREVDRVTGGTTYSRLERMCRLGLSQAPGLPQAVATSPASAQARAAGGPAVSLPAMDSGSPFALAGQQRNVAPATVPAPFGAAAPNAGLAAPLAGPRANAAVAGDDALVAASVRLRVEDADGHSCGSGTIIDVRGNEALIVTCGHIFRDSQGKGRIEVDLFGPGGEQRIPGTLKSYDLTRDVGLVIIRVPGPLAAVRVAPPGYRIGQGEPVVSVGCNNGGQPTAVRSRVTSVDKFLGPPNLQVAGQPVEGRSGGGLFSSDGLLIGVCNAADPSDREGLFAALPSIHAELDHSGLAFVYQATGDRAMAQTDPPPRGNLVPVERVAAPGRVVPTVWNSGPAGGATAAAGLASGDSSGLAKEEQAALDEIRRRLHDGAEVVCVIRSRRDPTAKSEVIMLDKVSPEFLKQLASESRSDDPRHLTSLAVPRTLPGASEGGFDKPLPKTLPPTQASPPGQWPAAPAWPGEVSRANVRQ